MDQTREASIQRRKHPSFGLRDSRFEEGKKVELQESVKLRSESDHDDGHSFAIISKRKRDSQKEGSVGNESDHTQQRSFQWRISNVIPKKSRSSNNSSLPKKLHKSIGFQTSKSSSPNNEEHIETEIAELLYGLKSRRNQDSSEKLQTNGEYGKKKVEEKNSSTLASKSSTAELVKIESEKLDDDTKSYIPNKDIIKKVNLEPIDLMTPPTDLELGNNIKIEDNKDTKTDTSKKNQQVMKIEIDHQVNKTVSPAWSRNLLPLGYVPQSMQPIVKTDKSTIESSSSTALQLVDFVLSPPRPKHCASHHYIARNIFLHQQLLWVHSGSLCGTKPNNVDDVPTPESMMIIGQQSQVMKKELVASSNKEPDASSTSVDSMQMEQQGPYIMVSKQLTNPDQSVVATSHARGGNSSCASSSNNSISSFASSLVRDASPTAQNSSTSIGLSSSHKQSYGVQVKANNTLSSPVAQRQQSQKNVYSQNLTIPIQPKNFGEKKKEALKGDFELVSSQSFAISFHSRPSVAWQGYYSSSWTTQQDDEKKVNSGKSSSTTNEPATTLVFDDSSKYLSFVLSPKNGTWLDHHSMVSTATMASSSQHLLQLHKQHNMQQQQQQQPPIVTQYKASNSNSPNNSSFHSKRSRRSLDSQHCFLRNKEEFHKVML